MSHETAILTWLDYTIIVCSLLLSTCVGSFFGLFKKGTKGNAAAEYLDGGHDLKVIPVSISICASAISSIGILGIVGETYEFGPHHLVGTLVIFSSAIVGVTLFLPVFYKLRVSSVFEYLELRFDKKIRTLTSALFIMESILYPSIVTYCSSLALTEMSGLNLHLVNAMSCGICILYTMLGGIKGVIWTDTLQAWAMIGSMIAVIYFAVKDAGGLAKVTEIIGDRHHLDVDFSLNPFKRATFWSATIGFPWYMFCCLFLNQSNVQRFNALSSFKDVKYTSFIMAFGCTFLLCLSHSLALAFVALYKDCDPIKSMEVNKSPELLPYFIVHNTRNIPGFSGIFIAGLFCAGLSTMSAKLNSAAGVIYNDFISQFYDNKLSDKTAVRIMQSATIGIGITYILMGFLIDTMGQVVQVCSAFQGICYGAVGGLFTLGLLVPRCNVKGAYVGGIVGSIVVGIVVIGNQIMVANGSLKQKTLTSIDKCINVTFTDEDSSEEPLFIYNLSYQYYCLLGSLVTVVVGYIVSYITGFQDLKKLNPDHVSPCLQNWLKRKQKTEKVCNNIAADVELKLLKEKEDTNFS